MIKKRTHIDYINDPKLIKELSLETIDAWITESPYVQSYHIIKAIKLKSLYGVTDKSHFNKVATVISDRIKLYSILEDDSVKKKKKKRKKSESPENQDNDIKENTESMSLESQSNDSTGVGANETKILAPVGISTVDHPEKNTEILIEVEESIEDLDFALEETKNVKIFEEEEESFEELSFLEESISSKILEEEEESVEDWDMNIIEEKESEKPEKIISPILETKEEAAVSSKKLSEELSEFSEWLLAFSRTEDEVNEDRLDKGISIDNAAVSETLAQLMYKQGHIDKAVDMYEKLSLINPEKSAYFAALIEKIKK